ncbi:MAG: ABC transporter permease, partial [Chloroflexi bacterium]
MAVIAGRPKRGALLPGPLAAVTDSRAGSLGVYVVRRVLWMIPVVFFVIVITFVLMHSAQGSPWDKAGGRQLSQVVVDNLNKKYGLDKPVWEQFLLYVWNVLRAGSLGVYVVRRVLWMIPVVFFVIVITFVLMHSAQGSPWDKAGGRQLSQVVIDNLNKKYGLDKPVWEQFLLYVWNVLHFDFGLSYQYQGKTVLELIGGGWPYTARLTRASTLETIRQDYIRTAWAKGLSERLVVVRHVLKNSLIPVVTTLGPTFAFLVTGSVIVEQVFSIPGIGRAF